MDVLGVLLSKGPRPLGRRICFSCLAASYSELLSFNNSINAFYPFEYSKHASPGMGADLKGSLKRIVI